MTDDPKRLTLILDRANPLIEPDYSIAGHTWCGRCNHKVWVGTETMPTLLRTDVEVWPMCLDCANEIAKEQPDVFSSTTVVDHVVDAEVCPKCGQKHLPRPRPMDN